MSGQINLKKGGGSVHTILLSIRPGKHIYNSDKTERKLEMFGSAMTITIEGVTVELVPPRESDIPMLAEGMSRLSITMYTQRLYAITEKSEVKWFEKMSEDPDNIAWGIKPDKSENIVGVTSLHKITDTGFCTSGITIFDKDWWGKGLASRAHIMRTYFAADFLNRTVIKSNVRVGNEASKKVLEKVGYQMTGIDPKSEFRLGRFLDNYNFSWFHPERIFLIFPEGLPTEYSEAVARAKATLELARDSVKFL